MKLCCRRCCSILQTVLSNKKAESFLILNGHASHSRHKRIKTKATPNGYLFPPKSQWLPPLNTNGILFFYSSQDLSMKRRSPEEPSKPILPSHEEILTLWWQGSKYIGPGKKCVQRCSNCHRWNYETRYQKAVLMIKHPSISHTCATGGPCKSLATCPTNYKEGKWVTVDLMEFHTYIFYILGHPTEAQTEKCERLAHRLDNPSIQSWKKYEEALVA